MCGEEDVSKCRAAYETQGVSLGLFGSRRPQFWHELTDKSGIIARGRMHNVSASTEMLRSLSLNASKN